MTRAKGKSQPSSVRTSAKGPLKRYRVLAVIEWDEAGFQAYTPSLAGAVSEGQSVDDALRNLAEAVQGCILAYCDRGMEIPWTDAAPIGKPVAYQGWIEVDA